MVQGTLLYKGHVVIPQGSSLISMHLKEYHGSAIGGHLGVLKTLKRVAASVYWEGMKCDIHACVASCPVCQQNKTSTLSPADLLQPLPVPEIVWVDISMDFIER